MSTDLRGKLEAYLLELRESANLKHGLAPHASAQAFAIADQIEALLRETAEESEVRTLLLISGFQK